MKTIDVLLDEMFDDRPHALRSAFQQWLTASRRFTAFVEDNRDKVRKKIRLRHEPAEIADLKWELEVAYRLHNDKRFTVQYEAYTRAQPIGPDYRVEFTTSFAFNVEVTRLHNAIEGDGARRLAETACNKLHQVMPNMPNVVAIGVPALTADEASFADAMAILRAGVEKREPSIMVRLPFNNTAQFIRAFEQLSVVVIRSTDDAQAFLWRNPAAKSTLPAKALTALRNCFNMNA